MISTELNQLDLVKLTGPVHCSIRSWSRKICRIPAALAARTSTQLGRHYDDDEA